MKTNEVITIPSHPAHRHIMQALYYRSVNIQLNIDTCPTYPDKFIRDMLSTVSSTLGCNCHTAHSIDVTSSSPRWPPGGSTVARNCHGRLSTSALVRCVACWLYFGFAVMRPRARTGETDRGRGQPRVTWPRGGGHVVIMSSATQYDMTRSSPYIARRWGFCLPRTTQGLQWQIQGGRLPEILKEVWPGRPG